MQTNEVQQVELGYEWISCPICGSWEDTRVLFSKWYDGFINLEGFNNYFISQCENCGLIYCNPRLALPLYRRLYPSLPRDSMLMRTDAVYMGFLQYKYMDLFMKPILEQYPRPKILDYITQDGLFLHSVKERYHNCELYGHEMREGMAQSTRQKGIEVRCSLIEDAGYPDEFFDVIMTRHTLEHLYEPVIAVKELHRILKADGLLIVELPNVDTLARMIFGKHWSGWWERHINHFSPKTLRRFLDNTGFRVEKIIFPFYLSTSFETSLEKLIVAPFLKRLARTPRGKTPRSLRPLRKKVSALPIDPLWLAFLPVSLIGRLFKQTDVMIAFCRKK
jgi:SAM-dependent methyltransferase